MASYSLPLPSSHRSQTATRKRKRKPKPAVQGEVHVLDGSAQNTEYSAVITPEERIQRRLAGQPLDEPPPLFPFPHTPQANSPPTTFPLRDRSAHQAASLRSHHLAVMTTLLHKCLQAKDYKRASRALALILRTEIHGKFVDLRHAGLWGIGAEILLRTNNTLRTDSISREGFERAKLFYDKLALQHPWHRTWPNVTNAQDFKLAMFGLWIYLACVENKRILHAADEVAKELQAKKYELAEAERIAQEMDSLMSTIPFIDDLELLRLRAHVALWTADLLERLDELEVEVESNTSMQEQQMEQVWLGNTEVGGPVPAPPSNQKAANARQLASIMLAKLRGSRADEDSDVDDNDDMMSDKGTQE